MTREMTRSRPPTQPPSNRPLGDHPDWLLPVVNQPLAREPEGSSIPPRAVAGPGHIAGMPSAGSSKASRRAIGRGALGLAAASLLGVGGASIVRWRGHAAASEEATEESRKRASLTGPVTYVALGASDAVGYGADNPAREGWVTLLAQHLPAGSRLVNLGSPGITLSRALQETVPRAVRAQPGLVTIWLVINDVLEGVTVDQYRANLDRLLAQLREETPAHVAIGNLPDPPTSLGGIRVPGMLRQAVVAPWNQAIAGAVRRHDAILVDVHREWPVAQHPEFIGPDGFHPTAVGYRALAEVFARTLRREGLL
jgi:acyl-CoA thioesterase I